MQSAIRVLFVSHAADSGGAQRCLLLLLESLDRKRFSPIVVMPGPGKFAEKVRELGIPVFFCEMRWWVAIRPHLVSKQELHFCEGLQSRTDALVELIERERIDVVFTNTGVVIEGALAAAISGRPHIWHLLEVMSADPDLTPIVSVSAFYGLVGSLSYGIAAVSRIVAEDVSKHCPEAQVRIIHTGMAEDSKGIARNKKELFGIPEDVPLISFLGLLSARKGILSLIEAMPLVLSRVPSAQLVVAGGEGGVLGQVRRKIKSLKLAHHVHLLGLRSDAADIIASSDAIAVPSLSDPLPLVVLEAMGAGKPVVGTQSGGCQDMILDGQTGFVVPPGDSAAIADKLAYLLMNPQIGLTFGSAGRVRLRENFQPSQNAEKFQKLIESAAQERTASSLRSNAAKAMLGFIERFAAVSPPRLLAHRIESKIRLLYRAMRYGACRITRKPQIGLVPPFAWPFWT